MLYGPRESQVKDLTLAHCVQAKKRYPFQLVPVTALATWERLPRFGRPQAKPLSSTMSLSSLPLGGRAARPD